MCDEYNSTLKAIHTTRIAGLTFEFSFNSKCHCNIDIEQLKTKHDM